MRQSQKSLLSQLLRAMATACRGEKGYWKSRLYMLLSTLPNCSRTRPPRSGYPTVFLHELEVLDRRLFNPVVKVEDEGLVLC